MKKICIVLMCCMFCLPTYARCTIKYTKGSLSGSTISGTTPSNTNTTGTSFVVGNNPYTCDNCGFVGWLVTSSNQNYLPNEGRIVSPGDTFTAPGMSYCANKTFGLTLTAQWAPIGDFVTPTSRAYTNTEFDKKLDVLPALGNNKIMAFADQNSPDQLGTPVNIINTLGTQVNGDYPTTGTDSDSVVTRDAIKAANANKMTYPIGSAKSVMAYGTTGNAGVARPIYSDNVPYYYGLIDADTLNNAAVNAVNSEFTQVDENGNPSSTGILWRLNDDITYMPTNDCDVPGSQNRTLCKKSLIGENDCNDQSLQNGTFTIVYDECDDGDGNIAYPAGSLAGMFVCSSTPPERLVEGFVPNQQAQSTIQSDYNSWVNNGRPSTVTGDYCYAKLTGPVPSNAASPWVYTEQYNSDPEDEDPHRACAEYCGVDGNAAFEFEVESLPTLFNYMR